MTSKKCYLPSTALVLLSLLGAGDETPAAEIDHAPELSQTLHDGGAVEQRSIQRAKSDSLFGRTTVYASFDPPSDKECFALGGLFALDKHGVVSFTYPHAIAPNVSLGSTRQAEERVLTFQGDKCRILIFVSREVGDGNQWLALHPVTSALAAEHDRHSGDTGTLHLAPGQSITIVPGITATDDPGSGKARIDVDVGKFDKYDDSYLIQAAKFYGDPQPDCLQGQAFFSITPSGLTLIFNTPRNDLPFSIEERIVSADQSKWIRFGAQTCRLPIRTVKEIKKGEVWTRLAPTD
jgi:hypothetical protein